MLIARRDSSVRATGTVRGAGRRPWRSGGPEGILERSKRVAAGIQSARRRRNAVTAS